MDRKQVGILIFPDVEVLDFAGPYEVFSVARLSEERCSGESVARATARHMEYPYPENVARRIAV